MIDAEAIIKTAGYLGIFMVIFAESGLFFGFFLPGDSLLFTAGFFAAQGIFGLSFWPLFIGCFAAAVAGDSVGYGFGRSVGAHLFKREESLLFPRSHVEQAQAFYERHGGKTIVLARFVPVVRTFAPIVAGIGTMSYRKFVSFNLAGGFIWTVSLIGLGYLLGSVPGMERYVHLVIGAIVVLSVSPAIWHFLRSRRGRRADSSK